MGNKGTHVFNGDGPDINFNQPILAGLRRAVPAQHSPALLRRARWAATALRFGLTTDMRYLCNCADNNYHSMQAKLTKRFTHGYSLLADLHAAADPEPRRRPVLLRPRPRVRHARLGCARTSSRWPARSSCRFGRGRQLRWPTSRRARLRCSAGWQLNAQRARSTAASTCNVDYRDAGQDRDTGPNRPRRHRRHHGGRRQPGPAGSTRTPIGSPGSAFSSAGRGDLRRHGARLARSDRALERGRVALQAVPLHDTTNLEFRVEVTNVFNHVALGNPDTTIGVPGNDNPNAGRITSVAPNWRAQPAVRRGFSFSDFDRGGGREDESLHCLPAYQNVSASRPAEPAPGEGPPAAPARPRSSSRSRPRWTSSRNGCPRPRPTRALHVVLLHDRRRAPRTPWSPGRRTCGPGGPPSVP